MSNPKTLIGLMGYAGSGKDSLYNFLFAHTGAERLAFADGVKREVADATWLSLKEIEENKPAFRELLQAWGSWRRNYVRPTYWIDVVKFDLAVSLPEIAVITDVRYANEAEWIRERGGFLIRVDRPGVGAANLHESENVWRTIEPDMVVNNKGSLEDLEEIALGVLAICHSHKQEA